MNNSLPLTLTAPGEVVTVAEVRAGWGAGRRLADMGLVPGIQIQVVNSQRHGPVIINLRGSRLALGRGIAQKILVQPYEQSQ